MSLMKNSSQVIVFWKSTFEHLLFEGVILMSLIKNIFKSSFITLSFCNKRLLSFACNPYCETEFLRNRKVNRKLVLLYNSSNNVLINTSVSCFLVYLWLPHIYLCWLHFSLFTINRKIPLKKYSSVKDCVV